LAPINDESNPPSITMPQLQNEVLKIAETLEPKPFVSSDKIEFHDFNIFENEDA
jgi:hypothetical protein